MKFDLTAAKFALHEMFVVNWNISIDQNIETLLYKHIKYNHVYKIRKKAECLDP